MCPCFDAICVSAHTRVCMRVCFAPACMCARTRSYTCAYASFVVRPLLFDSLVFVCSIVGMFVVCRFVNVFVRLLVGLRVWLFLFLFVRRFANPFGLIWSVCARACFVW